MFNLKFSAVIIIIIIYLTKKQTIQIQDNTKYNTFTLYIRMAQETNKENKCYMRVWADKININCCCSEACQPNVASTIQNTYKFNIQDIVYSLHQVRR